MIEKHKIGTNNLIYMFIIFLYFFPKYIEYTTFMSINDISLILSVIKAFSYVLALILIIVKNYKTKRLLSKSYIFILIILSYFSYQALFRDNSSIFIVLLFSLGFDECYFDKYLKKIYWASCIMYIVTIIACKIGVIENIVTQRNKFGDIWVAGGCGFGYSGQMIMMLIPIVFLYYYLKDGSITWKDNLLWIFITGIVYSQCKTITGSTLIIIFIIIYNILNNKKATKDSFLLKSKLILYSPFVFCTLTFLIEYLYKKGYKIGQCLDIFLNGRLSVTSRIVDKYGITFFGTKFVNNVVDEYEILDSEYFHMLITGGILFLIISLLLCVMLVYYAQKRKDSCLVLILVLFFFNSIVNNGIFGIVMNPFCILIIPAIMLVYRNGQEKFQEKRRKMKIRVNYNAEGYPIKRMILNKTINPYVKVSKAWDVKLIFMQVLSKIFPEIDKNNFYNRLKFTYKPIIKFEGVMHVFNTIYIGKSPWVCTVEYMYPAAYNKMDKLKYDNYVKKMLKYVIKPNCAKLMPMSEFSKSRIIHDLSNIVTNDIFTEIVKKITVVYPPQKLLITQSEIECKFKQNNEITFCFIGRDFWRKGGYVSYKALQKSRERYSNFKLIIISSLHDDGEWYTTEKKSIRSDLLNSDFVEWYEELDNNEVIDILKRSHIGLLPTYGDTFGFSILEMQACGCPCITTNGFALSEINNDECGWVLSGYDDISDEYSLEEKNSIQNSRIEALSKLIETKILNNTNIKNEISAKAINSLKKIDNEHNPSKYAEKINDIYSEAIKK